MHLNYIWEWSIHYYYVNPITQQYESNQVATMKNKVGPCAPVIVWSWSIRCPSLSAIFDSLDSNTNQELFEKYLCNHGSHYEKYGRLLITQRKPSRATTLFNVGKDDWNTKEDTSKSLKNALHILWYAKRHLSSWSNVEQWKNQACSLSCYQVTLIWRKAGRQAGSKTRS